jgi:hypothetical protein
LQYFFLNLSHKNTCSYVLKNIFFLNWLLILIRCFPLVCLKMLITCISIRTFLTKKLWWSSINILKAEIFLSKWAPNLAGESYEDYIHQDPAENIILKIKICPDPTSQFSFPESYFSLAHFLHFSQIPNLNYH